MKNKIEIHEKFGTVIVLIIKKSSEYTLRIWCFCLLIESYRRLKFWNGLQLTNGKISGHPKLVYFISEKKLYFIFHW